MEPGTITENNMRTMDIERGAHNKRKSTVESKKGRRLNYLKKTVEE